MTTAATIDVLLKANTATYRAAMVDAARVTNQQLGRIQTEVKQTAAVMQQMRAAAIGIVNIQALRAGGNALLDVVKQNQALVNSMQASVGSARDSADALAFVSQAAKELGLDYQSAAEGFQRLTASATANGIAMRDQQELFLQLSRAGTAMHLSSEQIDRAVTALSQSFSKGRFQAEELRQQLAEAIPGVVPRFQNAVMKMTEGTDLAGKSFDQLLQGGLLDVRKFLPAMVDAFRQMGVNAEAASSSLQAETNRMGNAWRELKLQLAEGAFSDTATAGIRATTVALEGMNTILPVLVPAMVAFAEVKVGERALSWIRGLNASYAAMLAEKGAAVQAAAALVAKTRAEAADAEATALRARAAYGGSIAADVAATAATNAHRQALIAYTEAQVAATAASSRLAIAGRAVLGFFGGPVGLITMIGLTAAQWLLFKQNTDASSQALVDWSQSADTAIEKFRTLNQQQQAGELLKFNSEMTKTFEDLQRHIDSISNTLSNFGQQADFFAFRANAEKLTAAFQAGKISADDYSRGIANAADGALRGKQATGLFANALTEEKAAVGTLAREHERQQTILDTLTGKQHVAAAAARDHANAMIQLSQASQEATNRITAALASLPGQIERIGKSARQVAVLDVRDMFRSLAKDGVDFSDRSNKQVQKFISDGSQYIALQTKLASTQAAYDKQRTKGVAVSHAEADAAQTAIQNAITRQREYELELQAGDSLSASKRELLKFEQELNFTKDKGIKAHADEIRAILETNVHLEDQIDAQRRLKEEKLRALAVDRQIADYMETMARQQQRDLQATMHGGNTAAWNGIANGVSDEFRQQRKSLDDEFRNRLASIPLDQMERRNEEQRQYLDLIGKTVIAESDALAKARENFEGLLAAQADWHNGARRAFEDYIAQAEDVASQTQELFANTFSNLEGTLTDFITKGKADWGSFLDQLLADSAKFVVKQGIAWAAKKFLPAGLGGGNGSEADALSGAATKLAGSAVPLYGAAAALAASASALAAAGLSKDFSGSTEGTGGWGSWVGALASIFGGGRAVGGPVSSGTAYLVGEQGPELFVPRASGRIVPSGQTAAMLGGAGGGGSVIQNISFLLPQRIDNRSQMQVSQKAGNAAAEAMQRNGR